MISHDYKCIFVHIPATAGTSIEEWIVGKDWWWISPRTKHLLASQARQEYSEYWDDYFKFSIVRDPVTRMRSCLRFPEVSFLRLNDVGDIDLDEYLRIYERNNVILEYDWRFHERNEVELPRHAPHSLYGNILDEDLDYIGHFEDLSGVIETLREKTGIDRPFSSHLQSSSKNLAGLEIGERTRLRIESLFWRDYTRFGFERSSNFDEASLASQEAKDAQLATENASNEPPELLNLRETVAELRLIRPAYVSLVDQINEKNTAILSLQETVQSLVVDRDSNKSAYESAVKLLQDTIENLVVDRDAYKSALEKKLVKNKGLLHRLKRRFIKR